MKELAILIPALRRPQNVQPLVQSIRATTKVDYEIVFVLSPGDEAERKAVEESNSTFYVMDANYEGKGDYARKINFGYSMSDAEWYFTGADDLRFHPWWFENAMRIGTCVIGTNDLGNPRVKAGMHSTHSLVNKQYIVEQGTIDEPNKILHEGYPHEYVDDEFVETAKRRGCWGLALASHVEHLHPFWGKAQTDDLYEASGQWRLRASRLLYARRRHLWM